MPKTSLKLKWHLGAVPQAYELIILFQFGFNGGRLLRKRLAARQLSRLYGTALWIPPIENV